VIRTGQLARKAGSDRIGQGVGHPAMQAVRPHGPLAASEVAQQAAQRFVTFGDQVLVGALEGHAVQAPGAQVVSAARDHVVFANQR
jgi:hypothetical protein